MKKLIALMLCLTLCLGLLAGCGQKQEPETQPAPEAVPEEPAPQEEPAADDRPLLGVWYSADQNDCVAVLAEDLLLLAGADKLQCASYVREGNDLQVVAFGVRSGDNLVEEKLNFTWSPDKDTVQKNDIVYERTHETGHYEMVMQALTTLQDQGMENWQTQQEMNEGSGILSAYWAGLEHEIFEYMLTTRKPEERQPLQEQMLAMLEARMAALDALQEENGSMGPLMANLQACEDSRANILELLGLQGSMEADLLGQGSCTDGVTWKLSKDHVLTISGTGDMGRWTLEDANAKEEVNGTIVPAIVLQIVVEEGVTAISPRAFMGLQALKTVQLPQSLRVIGDSAFRFCDQLTELTIPEGVTQIDPSAFGDCGSLKIVRLPDTLSRIEQEAFTGTAIEELILPDTVVAVGTGAFMGCAELLHVQLPEKLESIGQSAFNSCAKLRTVTIPASVTACGVSAFSDCESLESIQVDSDNTTFRAVDGVLFTEDGKTLLQYPGGKAGDYEIPEGTIEVAERAFQGVLQLTEVRHPESLSMVGARAYAACRNLRALHYGKYVTSIDPTAFAGDISLRELSFAEGSVKYQCADLMLFDTERSALICCLPAAGEAPVIPEGTRIIAENAFSTYSSLKKITIPSSVVSIEKDAFEGRTDLETISYNGTFDGWKEISIADGNDDLIYAELTTN